MSKFGGLEFANRVSEVQPMTLEYNLQDRVSGGQNEFHHIFLDAQAKI